MSEESPVCSESNEIVDLAANPSADRSDSTVQRFPPGLHGSSDAMVARAADPSAASWLVSLLFWLTLCVAAVMYAAVALAPKTADWLSARQHYVDNARRLGELENEVEYLERVAGALKEDPEFARRLAQSTLNASEQQETGRTLLPVTQDLLFGGIQPVSPEQTAADRPAWERWIYLLAASTVHRRVLLGTAIVLTLLGFTFLNGSENGYLRSMAKTIAVLVSAPARRYRLRHSMPGDGGGPSTSQPTNSRPLSAGQHGQTVLPESDV